MDVDMKGHMSTPLKFFSITLHLHYSLKKDILSYIYIFKNCIAFQFKF